MDTLSPCYLFLCLSDGLLTLLFGNTLSFLLGFVCLPLLGIFLDSRSFTQTGKDGVETFIYTRKIAVMLSLNTSIIATKMTAHHCCSYFCAFSSVRYATENLTSFDANDGLTMLTVQFAFCLDVCFVLHVNSLFHNFILHF